MPLYYFFLIPIIGLWFVSFIKAKPIIKKQLKLNSRSFEDGACQASLVKKEPKLNSISFNQGRACQASRVKKVLIRLFPPYQQLRNFHTTNRPIIKRRKSLYDVVACAEKKISIESSASPQAQDHIISNILINL
jgi:hypothetical protein